MRENRDVLRELDWSKVYADVPGTVRDAAYIARLRIRERERRRRRNLRAAACAACLTVVVGAAALLLRGGAATPDRVVPLAPDAIHMSADTEVYASREDAHYHLRPDCARIEGETVVLKLVTALEFEKIPCPACGSNAVVEG